MKVTCRSSFRASRTLCDRKVTHVSEKLLSHPGIFFSQVAAARLGFRLGRAAPFCTLLIVSIWPIK